jgi:DNA-directed RNA polymerase subunit RPC12/RpoP
MRYHCHFCGKSVTSELPNDAVIRAALVCPECLEEGKILFQTEPVQLKLPFEVKK